MNRPYYTVVPANIRYDDRLSAGAKVFYGELVGISSDIDISYFASLYDVSERTILDWIENLREEGHIT